MRLSFGAVVLSSLLALGTLPVAAFAQGVESFDLPAQPLVDSLRTIASQSNSNVFFDPAVVAGKQGRAVKVSGTVEGVLKELLEGTGLTYRFSDERTVRIVEVGEVRAAVDRQGLSLAQVDSGAAQGGGDEDGVKGDKQSVENSDQETFPQEVDEEVVVTGTHIRGIAPDSSPLTIYDQEYIEKSGTNTVEQLLRQLPQNFASTDSMSLGHAIGALSGGLNQLGSSYAGQSGINLHGLGPTSTLVLLNGHRLAPSGRRGDFVDVSAIPLSAIERIEVLTDGASALYGADAIAGVVNFVLKRDFEGGKTTVRGGGATRGGARQMGAAQLLGASWREGNALIAYDYDYQDGLLSAKRAFVPSALTSSSLLPEVTRHSVLTAGRQELPLGVSAVLDAYYSDARSVGQTGGPNSTSTAFAVTEGDIKSYGSALGLSRDVLDDWQIDLTGNYGKVEQQSQGYIGTLSSPLLTPTSRSQAEASILQLDIKADGPLLPLGTDTIKLAIGAGLRKEEGSTPFSLVTAGVDQMERDIKSIYAELFVPVISSDIGRMFARRLELSVSARHDDYGNSVSSTNPKVGVLWKPMEDLGFRTTYATAFRAPLLEQLLFVPNYRVDDLRDVSAPDGITRTLTNGSGGGSLEPEEAETVTVGFDFRPRALKSFSLAATYFQTRFTNRLAAPPLIGGFRNLFSNESLLGPLIDRTPDPLEVQNVFAHPNWIAANLVGADAQSIEATFDLRTRNLAASKESGMDVAFSYGFETSLGSISTSLSGTYLFDLGHRTIDTTPFVDFRNRTGQPMDLRLHAGLGWSLSAFSSNIKVNYAEGYENNLFSPARTVDPWVTADLFLGYKLGGRGGVANNFSVTLSVQNVTDEDPPFLDSPSTQVGLDGGYDALNASPVGRSVGVQLSKAW